MINRKNIIQTCDNEIDFSLIRKYCMQLTTKAETRLIEEQIIIDPMLADAVEGYMQQNDWNKIEKINNTMLHHHANIQYADQEQQVWEPEVEPKNNNPKNNKPMLKWLAIAAAVVSLLGASFLIGKMSNKSETPKTATTEEKTNENIASADKKEEAPAASNVDKNESSNAKNTNTSGESLFDFNRMADKINNDASKAVKTTQLAEVVADTRTQDEIVGSKNEAIAMLEKQANSAENNEAIEMQADKSTSKEKSSKKAEAKLENESESVKPTSAAPAAVVVEKKPVPKPKMTDAQVQSNIYQATEMINNGQTNKAFELLDKVLIDYPNNADAHLQKLKGNLKNGNAEASYKSIRKVNRTGAQYEELRWQTAKLLSKKNHPKAFILLSEIIDKKSNKYYDEAYKLTKFHNPDKGDDTEEKKEEGASEN